MNEKYEIIKKEIVDDPEELSQEIRSYISISEKLEANSNIISQIENMQKQIEEHNPEESFTFKVVESSESGKQYPKDMNFIDLSKQEISVDSFKSQFDRDSKGIIIDD